MDVIKCFEAAADCRCTGKLVVVCGAVITSAKAQQASPVEQ